MTKHKTQSEIVQMPSAQIESLEIVQMPSAQMEYAPLPSILTITTFSNHLEILNRTHSYQEAVFYMLYAAQQQLTTNELRRSIVSLHDYCRFLDQEISNNMIDKE